MSSGASGRSGSRVAQAPPPEHPAADWSPDDDLSRIANATDACRACDLWARATQAVFGAGPRDAPLLLVGEQPGDREDLVGQPFVGPAGAMLDKALAEAGIDRGRVFVTNVVKHFKWKPSGKRRLHEKPNAREVRACRPWLDLELAAVRPAVVMPLGATAATALLGPTFRVTERRGEVIHADGDVDGPVYVATFHPSAILRAPDAAARDAMYRALVDDLRTGLRLAGAASDRSGRRSGSGPRAPRGGRRSDRAGAAARPAMPEGPRER